MGEGERGRELYLVRSRTQLGRSRHPLPCGSGQLNIHITSTNTSSAQNCIRIYIPKLLTDLPTEIQDKVNSLLFWFCKLL